MRMSTSFKPVGYSFVDSSSSLVGVDIASDIATMCLVCAAVERVKTIAGFGAGKRKSNRQVGNVMGVTSLVDHEYSNLCS